MSGARGRATTITIAATVTKVFAVGVAACGGGRVGSIAMAILVRDLAAWTNLAA